VARASADDNLLREWLGGVTNGAWLERVCAYAGAISGSSGRAIRRCTERALLDDEWEGTIAPKRATGSREVWQSPQSPAVVAISTASDGRYAEKSLHTSAKRGGEITGIGEVTIKGDAVR
jgi:hypothetical protein